MLQMLRAAGVKRCRVSCVVADGGTGAGVESVLSLGAGCVVLSLGRAVGWSKGQEGVREGGQTGSSDQDSAGGWPRRRRSWRVKDGGERGEASVRTNGGWWTVTVTVDGTVDDGRGQLGRDRLVSAWPQTTSGPLCCVRHCVLRRRQRADREPSLVSLKSDVREARPGHV